MLSLCSKTFAVGRVSMMLFMKKVSAHEQSSNFVYCCQLPFMYSESKIHNFVVYYESAAREGGKGPSIWDTCAHKYPGICIFLLQ